MSEWVYTIGLVLPYLLFSSSCDIRRVPPPESIEEEVKDTSPSPTDRIKQDPLPAGFPTKYDGLIKRAWLKHLPLEWGHRHFGFRANLAVESSLRTEVESSAGAVGIGQQIPGSASDCRKMGKIKGRRKDVRFSTNCSAWLHNRNRRIWFANRSENCHVDLTRGCYITGCGHLIEAQKIATQNGYAAQCVEDLLPFLPQVIGTQNTQEVAKYVQRIAELEERMTP